MGTGLKITAGMTPDDVIYSSEATSKQKALAKFFDSDGIEGYSEQEASIFNATTITRKGRRSFSIERMEDGHHKIAILKKQKKDGTFKKETYLSYKPDNHIESFMTRVWDEKSNDWIVTEEDSFYPNGFLKTSKLKKPSPEGKETSIIYHNNYNPQVISVREFRENEWVETSRKEYNWKGNLTKKVTVK